MQPDRENIHKTQLARAWAGRYTDVSIEYIGQAALMPFSSGHRTVTFRQTPSVGNERAAVGVCASDTAEYIADVCREMAKLAKAKKLDSVAYLLDMAQAEASCVKNGDR